ncbi:MAG: hypothetical protein AAGC68_13775, partial [Verrucomicrobiota bacterium]
SIPVCNRGKCSTAWIASTQLSEPPCISPVPVTGQLRTSLVNETSRPAVVERFGDFSQWDDASLPAQKQ